MIHLKLNTVLYGSYISIFKKFVIGKKKKIVNVPQTIKL